MSTVINISDFTTDLYVKDLVTKVIDDFNSIDFNSTDKLDNIDKFIKILDTLIIKKNILSSVEVGDVDTKEDIANADNLYKERANKFKEWKSSLFNIVTIPGLDVNVDYTNPKDSVKIFINISKFLSAYLKAAKFQQPALKQDIVNLIHAMTIIACITSKVSNETVRPQYVSNMLLLWVWPIIESLVSKIDSTQQLQTPQKSVESFMKALYNPSDNTGYGLNDNLKRYLTDLGVTDIPDEYRDRWRPAQYENLVGDQYKLLEAYSKDLYMLYKLIIRDTLLSKFRSIDHTLLDQGPNIVRMEAFIDELVFVNVHDIIDKEYSETYDALAQVLGKNKLLFPTQGETSLMYKILSKENYLKFLKHVAIDSSIDNFPRVRVEYLLKTLSEVVFQYVKTASQELYDVIDFIAKYIYGMMSNIMTLFELLHKYQTQFDSEDALEQTKVLTFIKIRNDDPNGRFNPRFRITTDKNLNSMLIEYTDDEHARCAQKIKDEISKNLALESGLACSKKGGEILRAIRRLRGGTKKSHPPNTEYKTNPPTKVVKKKEKKDLEITDEGCQLAESPKTKYIFGPFTKIFTPDQGAKGIAESAVIQNTIIRRLDSGNNVCIFGYGQSGSGKTSLLIYYKQCPNDDGEMGIMSRICDKTKYTKLTVKIKEVGDFGQGATIRSDDNEFYRPHNFIKTGDHWELNLDEHLSMGPLKKAFPTKTDLDNNELNINHDILKTLGGFVFFVTENMRLTKGTTNNPSSSRTHIFVFIKFTDGPTLIIGDFAGVENVFDCSNPIVLDKMSNIIIPSNKEFAYQQHLDKEYDRLIAKPYGPFEGKSYSQIYKEKNMLYMESKESKKAKEPKKAKDIIDLAKSKFLNKSGISVILQLHTAKTAFENNKSTIEKWTKYTSSEIVNNILKELSGISDLYQIIEPIFNPFGPGLDPTKLIGLGPITKVQFHDKLVDLFKKDGWYDFYIYQLIQSAKQSFMTGECTERVKEGSYINKSLKNFRMFLSYLLGKTGSVPQTSAFCNTLQCNPFYKDCYGSLFVGDNQTPDAQLVENCITTELCGADGNPVSLVNPTDCLQSLTFCVFNVINISQDKNDPPPVPFIDTNDLTFGYNSFKSNFMTLAVLMEILRSIPQRLKSHKTADAITVADIVADINTALGLPPHSGVEKIPFIIESLENFNASTFMGTMIFIDSIAKFGINKMLCIIEKPGNYDFNKDKTQLFSNISQITDLTLQLFNNTINQPKKISN